ncbi:MAG: efflux RND transporter permease subunit, partial [Nannocystaceae bacterium]
MRIQGVLASALLVACQPTTVAEVAKRVQDQGAAQAKPAEVPAPVVLVRFEAPGYAPLDLEALVAGPVEASLSSLKDVQRITSESSAGSVVVQVEFTRGVALEKALELVRSGLDGVAAQLPDEIEAPLINGLRGERGPALIVAITSKGVALGELVTSSGKLERELASLAEVVRTQTCAPEKQLRIVLDPEVLAARGLGLGDISQGLRSVTRDVPKGTPPLQSLTSMVIGTRGEVPIRLGDIATVREDFSPDGCRARLDGQPAVTISVWTGEEKLRKTVAKTLENLREQLPEAMKVRIFEPEETDLLTLNLPPGTVPEAGFAHLDHLEVEVEHVLAEHSSEQDQVRVRVPTGAETRRAISEQIAAMPGVHLGEVLIAGHQDPAVATVQISGPELEVLQDMGQRFVTLAAKAEDVVQASVLGATRRPELVVEVNRARLAALGLNQPQVLELVTASRGGLLVRTISSDGRQIPVIVT